MDGDGFEPSKRVATDLQSAPFGHSGIHPNARISIDYIITTPSKKQVFFYLIKIPSPGNEQRAADRRHKKRQLSIPYRCRKNACIIALLRTHHNPA